MPALFRSVPGVADVEILRGRLAEDGPPDLLVEVPHAADRLEDYTAVRRLLKGVLPQDLEHFFFVNTDVGALAIGRTVARAVVAAAPHRSALVVACRVPEYIEYRIVAGAPVITHHLGQMWFRPDAGGTTLDYRMELAFRLPGDRLWAGIMKRLVQQRLRHLAKRIRQEESS